jgi:DnaJ-class molecular chaperone
MDFYNILNIKPTATKQEIKKAYNKLIIRYHPDKNPDINSKEKFIEIQTAYEILYDDIKRETYDNLNTEEKQQSYDLIKKYFTNIRPEYEYIYKSIIDFVYPDEEKTFEEDINSLNIENIFTRVFSKFKNREKKNYIDITSTKYDLILSFKEKYNEIFKYIRVIKDDKTYNEYMIPIHNDTFIIHDKDKGPVKINIICEIDKNYKIINDYDLFQIKNISLSSYIYGGKIKIHDPNMVSFWFDFESCLGKEPVYRIKDKGLPKNSIEDRGDLYIYFNIDGINSLNEDNDDIMREYSLVIEDTLRMLFPPLDN